MVVDDALLDDAAHSRTWRSASFRFLEDDLDLTQGVTEGLGLKDEPKSLLVRVGEQLVAVHRIAFRPQQPRARVEAYDMRWNLRPASQASHGDNRAPGCAEDSAARALHAALRPDPAIHCLAGRHRFANAESTAFISRARGPRLHRARAVPLPEQTHTVAGSP